MPNTLFDKLWALHHVRDLSGGESLIAIDRVFLHERTGSIALLSMQAAGYTPLRPAHVFCTMDHIVSNTEGRGADMARMPGGEAFITATRAAAQAAGIQLIDVLSPQQGIVHVISPELGIAQPGLTLVCPDSHTCSQGALGALAWGIGSTDAELAMVTGCLRVKKPRLMRIRVDGKLRAGVSAKDLALHIIARLGADGARRCAVEYAGTAIEALSVEARLTLCNMAVEFSAFTAVIAPDEKVYDYLKGREYAPQGEMWALALAQWQALYTDPEAVFDYEHVIDATEVEPTVSWGTSPEQALPIRGTVPAAENAKTRKALDYMGLCAGTPLTELALDGAFIGSCTNARLSDLRAAADILRGRKVAAHVKAMCVPGSMTVRRAAEAEGLDAVFRAAGFEWGLSGCALCFYAGGETFAPQARVISSTNRKFEGRQGPQVRTHLASPAIVAASAVAGHICHPDDLS